MPEYNNPNVPPFVPGQRKIPVSVLNGYDARLRRLERLTVAPPLTMYANANAIGIGIKLPNTQTEDIILFGRLQEALTEDQSKLFTGVKLYQDLSTTPHPTHGTFPFLDSEEEVKLRNLFNFTADIYSAFAALKFPTGSKEWILIQCPCPIVSSSSSGL